MGKKVVNKEKMTVHKALAELKIIGDRIEGAISETTFVIANRHSNTRIHGASISEFADSLRSRYQSVTDLIKRRDALKRAVVLSNAITKVSIGSREYTVAEAIEMKNTGIEYKKDLLDAMRRQYEHARNKCTHENEGLTVKADNYITGMYNQKDVTKLSDEMQKARNEYMAQNTFELVEPIKILDEIKQLEAEIADFITDVDSTLSVSNALSEIEFSY
jgi:hypothetical protein